MHLEAGATSGVAHALPPPRLVLLMIMIPVFLSAGFIILTSLTTAVTEQARELGILRCVGASRGQIGGAQLICGAGGGGAGRRGLGGVPLGLAAAYLLYRHNIHRWNLAFSRIGWRSGRP